MKPKYRDSRLSSLSTVIFAGVLAATSMNAATLYWDGTDTDANANGGAGAWNGANLWDTLAFGGANATWNSATPDSAVFGGTAGAVTTGAAITTGGIRFDTTGYTITADSVNTLSFSGTSNIRFNNIAAATITGTVGGSGSVNLSTSNPATAGTLTLNGTSTGGWSGTTTINAGMTMALAGNNQALLNTSAITLNGGGITLTNTTAGIDRVSSSAGITSNGGTITFTNTSGANIYAETIGSVDLARGQLNFVEATNQAGTGSQTLTLSGLTHTGAANTSAVSFGSAGGLNTTKNIIQVTGASGTGSGSGQIIGAWAYYGTAPASPTDYAVYDASGRVLNASIAATAENSASWTAGGNNVTLNGATILTGTRTLNSLRYSGGLGTLDLANSNLETYGLLNGGTGTLTVSTAGTGFLTTATGGGNLYITPGAAAITVSAAINNNAGAVTLVKSGSNTLTLSSTTSNYSGGTVINAGTLATTADSNLGNGGGITVNGNAIWNMGVASLVTYDRTLTINEGAVLTLNSGNAAKTVTGALTGSGSIIGGNSTGYIFTNTGNSFTGTVNNGFQMIFASLGDSSNAINLVGSSSEFQWSGGAKTFTDRPFTLNAAGTGNINNSGSGELVIKQDLAITGAAGARTLRLGTKLNNSITFNGDLANGTGSVLSLNITPFNAGTSSNGGTVNLSGTNTYSGATTISTQSNGGFSVNNTTVFQGKQSLSPNTAVTLNRGNNGAFTIKLLDDGTGNNGVISMPTSFTAGTATSGSVVTFFVGNNNTANGGNTTGASTGNTIALNDLTLTLSGGTTNVVGANGYRLQFNNINLATTAGAVNTTFNPTTAPLTIAGTVRQASSANTGAATLVLDGTAAGNLISGNVMDSADGTPRVLNVTKNNTSTWELSGTNTYTGITTVSAGVLEIGGSGTLGSGNYSANISIANTSGGTLKINSSANQILGGVVSGNGALVKDNEGTLTLTNTNNHNGSISVDGGTLLINGSTTSTSVAVTSGGTLGGSGSVSGSVTVKNGGTLASGNSIESLATGALSLEALSTLAYELDRDAAANESGDLTAVTGNLTLDLGNAAILTLTELGAGTWTAGEKLTLVSYSGTWNTGLFDYGGNTLLDNSTFAFSGFTWQFDYNDLDAGDNYIADLTGSTFVTMTAVSAIPEPSTALLGAIGFLALLRRKR